MEHEKDASIPRNSKKITIISYHLGSSRPLVLTFS